MKKENAIKSNLRVSLRKIAKKAIQIQNVVFLNTVFHIHGKLMGIKKLTKKICLPIFLQKKKIIKNPGLRLTILVTLHSSIKSTNILSQ